MYNVGGSYPIKVIKSNIWIKIQRDLVVVRQQVIKSNIWIKIQQDLVVVRQQVIKSNIKTKLNSVALVRERTIPISVGRHKVKYMN